MFSGGMGAEQMGSTGRAFSGEHRHPGRARSTEGMCSAERVFRLPTSWSANDVGQTDSKVV